MTLGALDLFFELQCNGSSMEIRTESPSGYRNFPLLPTGRNKSRTKESCEACRADGENARRGEEERHVIFDDDIGKPSYNYADEL
jgi:hypothetical protein